MNLNDFFAEEAQRSASNPPTAEPGVVTSILGNGRALVNCSGSNETIWVPLDIADLAVGDAVIVQRASSLVWVGARLPGSRLLPVLGRVSAVTAGSSTLTVLDEATGTSYSLPFLQSYTPVLNDRVRITWEGGTGVILGKLGAVPQPAPPAPDIVGGGTAAVQPPPAPPAIPTTGVSTFPALDARSFRSGKWRTDSAVISQGSYGSYGVNTGAWFYGQGPNATLAGATITRAQIRVKRNSGGDYAAQTVHFRLHGSSTRPGGNVSFTAGPTDSAIERFQVAWIDLPVSWGQGAVNSGYGIGIEGSPYVNLAGLDEDSESGLLRLEWRR